MMATQSILKNITITDLDDAEMLISAMEKAMNTADDSNSQFIESEVCQGRNLKNFGGECNSVLMGYCYCIDYDTNQRKQYS